MASRETVPADELFEFDEPLDAPAAAGRAVARAGLPPIVVPLLLVMAVANLALVGLTWKSLGGAQPASAPAASAPSAGAEPRETSAAAPAASVALDGAPARVPSLQGLTGSRDEAWGALDDAERAMDAGEFAAARRALYATLTVLDRVEASERRELEAHAGFLIAESYRRQARTLRPPEPAAEGTEVSR